ncbi:M56 family metallopeptidase [uncultured Acetatifactor sp.]|uniref:M56 family metallopeptidase n=1 Tax=uncultured Acetatifactor sp. TaxID=1671927 RepID=UPI0026252FFE|nr:M56 family metallopeptidase [uncultured Acetatifactor sp.]
MGGVFSKVLHMSIAASWLILAVIALRLLLRKAPKWIRCILWGIVAIRLICPVSFESTLSLVPNAEDIASAMVRFSGESMAADGGPTIVSPIEIGGGASMDARPDGMGGGVPVAVRPDGTVPGGHSLAAESRANLPYLWIETGGILWMIGLGSLLGYALIGYLRLRGSVSEAILLRDNIWIGDRVASPFILGMFRPRIYLSSSAEESQMGYMLAHEQAHIRRGDHWWKLLGYLLLAVYWFNPLSWVAYILLSRDMELACDEKVIRGLDEEEKKSYLFALLNCSAQRSMVLACPPAFGEVGVKQRVNAVLDYKKPGFWVVLVSVFLCLIVAVCFLTTSPKTWQIKVTIPAEGTESFYYSDEEINPKGNTLTLYAGEGMGDGMIVLLPVEASQENTYGEPTYITPGMPVKLDVEKGAWYKIGVNKMRDPSGEDKVVYLSVENVEVRIAAGAGTGAEAGAGTGTGTDVGMGTRAEADSANDAYIALREDGQDIVPEPLEGAMPLAPVFPIEFLFASGASSSGTELVLNQDGSFAGRHFDHENATGDGYSKGTCYLCDFSGRFEDIRQITPYIYSMTLAELDTEKEEGEEWIEDDVLYIAARPYGLEDGEEFLLYTPGVPLEEIPEEFLSWWMGRGSYQEDAGSRQTLPCYGLFNIAAGEGFFQYERDRAEG